MPSVSLAERASTVKAAPVIDCFPLPKSGRDPFFGFSGTFWRRCERDKLIKLKRFALPGRRASAVCVPYAEAAALLKKHGFIPGGHREIL